MGRGGGGRLNKISSLSPSPTTPTTCKGDTATTVVKDYDTSLCRVSIVCYERARLRRNMCDIRPGKFCLWLEGYNNKIIFTHLALMANGTLMRYRFQK